MLISHLPSGYLLGAYMQRRFQTRNVAVMTAALLGAYAPDFDMVYFHLIDGRRTHHHDYFTHWPIFWLATGVTLAFAAALYRRSLLMPVFAFSVGAILHMVLDSIAAPIHWLAPFSDAAIELVKIPKIHPNWIVSFVFHWTFLLELSICLVAGVVFIKRRSSIGEAPADHSSVHFNFPEKEA